MPRTNPIPDIGPGTVLCVFDAAQTALLVEQWLAAFGPDRHGVNAKAYLWHVFSAGRHPSLSGEAARSRYDEQTASEFVVLSNDRKQAFVTATRPYTCSLSDWCVFPVNLAWTMCFTHEDGWLGPYFAEHREYHARNEANLAAIRKTREVEEARRRGWC